MVCVVEGGQLTVVTVVIAAGQPLVKTGGCVSVTLTMKLHAALGKTPLLAVQLTVVWPTGKLAPDGGEQLTVGVGAPEAVTV